MGKALSLFLMGYVVFVFEISLCLFKQESKLTIPEESTSNSASSSQKNMAEDNQRSFLLLDGKENLQVRQNLE